MHNFFIHVSKPHYLQPYQSNTMYLSFEWCSMLEPPTCGVQTVAQQTPNNTNR